MENFNPYKKILDDQIKKTGEVNPVEEYDNLSEDERDISRNFWLQKERLPRDIDVFTHDVSQKEDDLDFLEKKLKKVESREVKILKKEAQIKDIKDEIEKLENEFFPQDKEYEQAQLKILELRKRRELLELSVDDAEQTISDFPAEILNYEKEIKKDYKKLDLFDKQTKNKEQN